MALIWILLPLAVLIGWFAAKRDNARRQRFLYYLSLRYLLGQDNPSASHEEHLSELPPSYQDNTVLLSLTLGDVFRNKGEIDRAITIHSHLADSDLIESTEQRSAKWSLALDFIAAGLLDRAEIILRDLLEFPEFTQMALLKLAHIYEQQRDWLQAIACLERTQERSKYTPEISHLYCELAEQEIKVIFSSLVAKRDLQLNESNELKELSFDAALNWVNLALNIYPHSARAALISAFIAIYQQNDHIAHKALNIIETQSIALIPLIAPLMQYIMRKTPHTFLIWLDNNLTQNPHINLILLKTHYLIAYESTPVALKFLEDTLSENPNLQGLLTFHHLNMLLYPKTSQKEHTTTSFDVYTRTFEKVIDHYAKYRCEHCGFVSKSLNWHCPSCQSWDTAFPVADIISLKGTISTPGA